MKTTNLVNILLESVRESNSRIEIKSKEDPRCAEDRCIMYDVYIEGKVVYEFSSISFKNKSTFEIATLLKHTPSLNITKKDSLLLAMRISKHLK